MIKESLMIQEAIQGLIEGRDLRRDQVRQVMELIMEGGATDAQISGFLVALRCKGEEVEEIAGCAEVMRAKATRINTSRTDLVDTCGTGGDGLGTFNISTTVAFVAAGAGLAVAKHGNRAMSSQCGSADVLQALGVNVEIGPEAVGRCINEVGIGFLFAPMLHGAMKYAIGPRRELGTRTVFNILGPLTNPAGARRQLLGVYDGKLTERLAGVLKALGSERAFVVHGKDGLDEITLTGPSRVTELKDGELTTYEVKPQDVGLQTATADQLAGGDAATNAAILQAVLENRATAAQRDVVLLNAAAAIAAGGSGPLVEGLEQAQDSLASGRAAAALENLKNVSNS
jgi:anthranilate phosphoribosyltransferase